MQIHLGHAGGRMPDKTLNRGEVHPHRLKLANIGVSAAMWGQYPHAIYGRQGSLELIPEIGWIAGLSGLAHLPDVLPRCMIPQKLRTDPQLLRHRNHPIAIP